MGGEINSSRLTQCWFEWFCNNKTVMFLISGRAMCGAEYLLDLLDWTAPSLRPDGDPVLWCVCLDQTEKRRFCFRHCSIFFRASERFQVTLLQTHALPIILHLKFLRYLHRFNMLPHKISLRPHLSKWPFHVRPYCVAQSCLESNLKSKSMQILQHC